MPYSSRDISILQTSGRFYRLRVNLSRPQLTAKVMLEAARVRDRGRWSGPAERGSILESGYSIAAAGTEFGLAILTGVVEARGWLIAVGEDAAGRLRLAVRSRS